MAAFIGAVGVLVGLGFGFFALYLALMPRFVPPVAAALTCLAALMLAAVILLMLLRAWRPLPRVAAQVPEQRPDEEELGAVLGSFVDLGIGAIRQNPQKVMAVALAAGFAFGTSPKLRHVAWELLKSATTQAGKQ